MAVRRGLSVVGQSSRPRELSDRFPFLGRSTRKKKKKAPSCWKVVPCCLRGPSSCQVPNKIELDDLCLGTLWFTRDEDPLELDFVNAEECLYPLMAGIPYQLCSLGNKALHVNDTSYYPETERPYFTVKMLKESVGIACIFGRCLGIRISQIQVHSFRVRVRVRVRVAFVSSFLYVTMILYSQYRPTHQPADVIATNVMKALGSPTTCMCALKVLQSLSVRLLV